MNMSIHSDWFPAAHAVAFVVVFLLAIELICALTHRHLISHVMWYLIANHAGPMIAVGVGLAAHFYWQKKDVYDEYRRKDKTDL